MLEGAVRDFLLDVLLPLRGRDRLILLDELRGSLPLLLLPLQLHRAQNSGTCRCDLRLAHILGSQRLPLGLLFQEEVRVRVVNILLLLKRQALVLTFQKLPGVANHVIVALVHAIAVRNAVRVLHRLVPLPLRLGLVAHAPGRGERQVLLYLRHLVLLHLLRRRELAVAAHGVGLGHLLCVEAVEVPFSLLSVLLLLDLALECISRLLLHLLFLRSIDLLPLEAAHGARAQLILGQGHICRCVLLGVAQVVLAARLFVVIRQGVIDVLLLACPLRLVLHGLNRLQDLLLGGHVRGENSLLLHLSELRSPLLRDLLV
mmetsp:Transcript_109336/g.316013  ORF Transcript_109336/g.316013 Transcript_109336/m.316013 type:complete len:316 (-) Transcript_109336:280-1227(-)